MEALLSSSKTKVEYIVTGDNDPTLLNGNSPTRERALANKGREKDEQPGQ